MSSTSTLRCSTTAGAATAGSDRDDRRRGARPDRVPPGELGRDLVPGLPSEFAGAVLGSGIDLLWSAGTRLVDRGAHDPVQSSELAFQLAVRMLVETLRLGADADDITVEAAGRALVGRLD